jgi:hypothetical protein
VFSFEKLVLFFLILPRQQVDLAKSTLKDL